METKEVLIPAVGETNQEPGLDGEAVQVERLDFLGSEDPLGNPRLRSQGGEEIDVPLSTRNPVKATFDGLEIRNPSNSDAAGTVALLRIYDDAENYVQNGNRVSPVAHAPVNLEDRILTAQEIISVGGAMNSRVIPEGRDREERIVGITCNVWDQGGQVDSGFRVVLKIMMNGFDIEAETVVAEVGCTKHINFAEGVVVPKDRWLEVEAYAKDEGSGEVTIDWDGVAHRDLNSEYPPQ